MLGGLWRLYRGVAALLFTLELGFIIWFAFSIGMFGNSLGSFAGSPGTKPTPSPTVAGTPDPRLAQVVIERSRTAAATPGARFTLEMSEAEVNALLTQQPQAPGVRDLAVGFQPGRVVLSARLSEPVPATVEAWGTLVARDGRLRTDVQEAKAGPLSLPQTAVDLIEDRANAALEATPALRGLYVEGVEVLAGRARVSARSLN